jgi:uncharacterized Zn finger protein (UPF0148 family)
VQDFTTAELAAELGRRKRRTPATCAQCGAPFEATKGAVYCSTACRHKAWSARERERIKAYRRERYKKSREQQT